MAGAMAQPPRSLDHASRSYEEATAASNGYADLLGELESRNWEAWNDAWLRLARLARLMFKPEMKGVA